MEKRLGKGITALIPETDDKTESIANLDIGTVAPSKYQPRKRFDEIKLKELIDSIREKGIIQPIVVRPTENGYELIAGERRFRAAKELGYTNIPAIIKDVSDADSLELALIENIQREELNAIEEAKAYKQLMDQFNFTHETISKAVGKDHSTVANTLRLLGLPEAVQRFVEDGAISMGHARSLLALQKESDMIRFAEKVIKKSLSVRQIEQLVKAAVNGELKLPSVKDANIVSIEEKLQQVLGTRVTISHYKKRGKIEIEYYSNDDLERVLNIITGQRSQEPPLTN